MFGRKRRGSSNPPLDRSNVNPNAATAAASAFLSSKPSNASLASAAAGAALRSRPTTPTSVADVQTKRTLRRNGSNSSAGSNVSGVSRPTLERRGSSGSMSERTFRDQSPGRGSIREAAVDVPPVPAIPQNLKPVIPPKSHKRSNSMETGPGRISSPPPNRVTGRGSSMGPLVGRTTSGRGGQRVTSLSSVQELTGVERPASRGSVNFSYPTTSPRGMSPAGSMRLTSPSPSSNRRPQSLQPAQITQNGTNLVYDPNTRSFRPFAEVLRYHEPLDQEPAERPIRNKKVVQPKGTASGSEIADGTHFGGPKGTAVNALNSAATRAVRERLAPPPIEQQYVTAEPVPQPPVTIQPLVTTQSPSTNLALAETIPRAMSEPKKKKKKRVTVMSESGSEQGYTSNMSSASDNESDASERPPKPRARPARGLQKRPSIVRELPEDEEHDVQEPVTPPISNNELDTDSPDVRGVSPTPLPKSNGSANGKGRGKAMAEAAFAQERQHTRSANEPPLSTETSPMQIETNGSAAGTASAQDPGNSVNRTASVSPVRTTRFAPAERPTNLAVMHQPPPRSISPRKSALKNSNSPRGPSPADDTPSSWSRKGQTSSDLSDNSIAFDEQPPRKKKTARVSFDDNNTVVGTAASPMVSEAAILPSPQNKDKRSWFGLKSRGKTMNLGDDEEDDLMKPRPMLPSFGSVRERKARESTEERPLVMPSESHHTAQATALTTPPSFTSPSGDTNVGASNDEVVGSILAQDAANKPKFLEPLPPEVTSVEGTGYSSDSSVNDSAVESQPTATHSGQRYTLTGREALPTLSSPDSDHLVFEDAENRDSPVEDLIGEVPKIAVTGSTPTLEETQKRKEWLVPGGFPSGSSDDSESPTQSDTDTITPGMLSETTPAAVGIAEPPAESVHLASHVTGATAESLHQNNAGSEETDESDHNSVYDDAAEDLSDGDGFLSLNAVAASPIKTQFKDQTPGLAISTPPDSPVDRIIKEKAFRQAKLQNNGTEPDMGEGWDKAQQYWASLTAEKKRELEKAAREESESSEEDEDEEDKEETPLPFKPKTKSVMVNPLPVELPARASSLHRTYQIAPGSKAVHHELPALRSSMRAHPPKDSKDTSTLRSSMRTNPSNNSKDTNTQMRKSMRNGGSLREPSQTATPMQPKGALQKKQRPLSYQPSVTQPDPVAVQKHVRHMSAAPLLNTPVNGNKKAAVAPQLKRSNSNDSDSSFKRTRTMAHSMRGSMRNPVTQDRSERTPRSYSPEGDKSRSSRFSIRSLSPTGSSTRRPFSGGAPVTLGQGTMRGTMRSTSNGPTKSSFGSGFGRAKAPPKSKTKAPRSIRRFDNSSDEEDDRPAFQSRFVDSSDEDDEPIPPLGRTMRGSTVRPAFTPASAVKKIPVINEGDSSDLPDSDDELPGTANNVQVKPQQQPTSSVAPTSLRRSGSGREYTPSSPILRDPQKQRGGFLNILRRKKDPSSKVRKVDGESGARKDTPLERSRSELLGVRQNSSGVLQKRNAPSRTSSASGTWPLSPAPLSPGFDQRPATADGAERANGGINGGERPALSGRRVTATGLLDVDIGGRKGSDANVVLGRSGKPKRFQGLRRVLGIKD